MGGRSSKSTMSWVAVVAVKAGPCRWCHAVRTGVQQNARTGGLRPSPAGAANKSATTVNQARRLQSGVASVRAAREAEKAENVMHLVCWGPK